MYFVVSWFLLYHQVVYGSPPREDMAMGEAEVDDEIYDFEYILGFQAVSGPGRVVVWDDMKN